MCASIRSRFGGVEVMKLSKLKRLLDCIVDERTLPIQRKCLLEDIVRDNNYATCGDCKYSCFNRCTAVEMNVLR